MLALLLAAAIDGQAALRHASALASLGPHPLGSPRGRAAAEYVAASFRAAGLDEVRLQPFESEGLRGANVIGVLRSSGSEQVVIAAHHDTAPESPGAYDDGGGVGILIEAARALSQVKSRPRTLVFVSFDGGESESLRPVTAAGSRAYVQSLGAGARDVVAALAVEMSGFKDGTPTLQPIAYPDLLRPGAFVIAPAWLVRAALQGAQQGGAPLALGDPRVPWLHQPAVRTFRATFHGDDLSFLQSGVPAVCVSDSSYSRVPPFLRAPQDTAEKLDPAALERMGQAVLGAAEALGQVRRAASTDSTYFVAFGFVLGAPALFGLALLSLVPGLYQSVRRGGVFLGARLLHALAFAALSLSNAVPTLFVFLLPNLLMSFLRRAGLKLLTLVPLLALAGVGLAAALRSAGGRRMVSGLWLSPWEIVAAAVGLALVWVPPAVAGKPAFKKIRLGRSRER